MEVNYNEAKALALLEQGEERGFQQLYDRYALRVARIGYKYLQSSRLTEDLVQEVFSTVWVERTQFAGADNFQSYLFTCTRNLALQYLKRLGREEAAKKKFLSRKDHSNNNIDDYMLDQEYAALVHQAVSSLPPQQKLVFTMAKDDGMSHKDIAQQLELSQATVSNHIVLAIKFIKLRVLRHIVSVIFFIGVS